MDGQQALATAIRLARTIHPDSQAQLIRYLENPTPGRLKMRIRVMRHPCNDKGVHGYLMIDVKQAVQIAKAKAAEMLEQSSTNLEEIERESYKDHDVWSITLSVPRTQISSLAHFADPLQYKRFLIDAETGELLAMKLREVASR